MGCEFLSTHINVVRGEIYTFFLQREQGPYTVGQNDVFGIQPLDMNTGVEPDF